MSLVFNERTKLTASWFNTLATALVATGVIAPVAALLYGIASVSLERIAVASIAAICAGAGICLHLMGRAWLGRLRE